MDKRKRRNILLTDNEYKQAVKQSRKMDMSFARFIRELLNDFFKRETK